MNFSTQLLIDSWDEVFQFLRVPKSKYTQMVIDNDSVDTAGALNTDSLLIGTASDLFIFKEKMKENKSDIHYMHPSMLKYMPELCRYLPQYYSIGKVDKKW